MNAHGTPLPEQLGGTHMLRWRFADIWTAPLTDLPIRDELLDQYVPLSPEMELLEIGPGSGFPAFRLSRSVKRLTALDVAAGNIARLEKVFARVRNLGLVCADICQPGVAASLGMQFDAIEAIEVFEFLPDPAAALKNMALLLRPGCRLYMQFPNTQNGAGTTFFLSREEFEAHLKAAGFERWELYVLRLRPWAQWLFRTFHEKPLNLYRRMQEFRNQRPNRPQVYEDTWAFRHGQGFESYKCAIHSYWAALLLLMRAGGDVFERTPAGNDIIGKNLFVVAQRPF